VDKAESGKRKAEAELPELDDRTKRKLHEILTWQYGFGAATERAAKSSVTALRRQAADELDDEAEQVFSFQLSGKRRVQNRKLNAADAGTAHHKFLQHISLENAGDPAALKAAAERLEREKVLSADEHGVLDLKAVAAFWNSDAGQKIRKQAANVKRELAFTAKFSPQELSEIVGTGSEAGLENEFIVVQGVADLVVVLPQEIWLVDFKTDEVGADDLPAKIKNYGPQLKLYARALAKIYARPVTSCWLHFLSAQKTESVKI
jgi:ATP-dependent helicase/nuclease subunit A